MTRGAILACLGALLLASLSALSCGDAQGTTGGADGGTSCPNDLPASCPTQVPSYAADIAPLIQERCAPCHFPGGGTSSKLLGTHAELYALRGQVLNQVHACKMPPAPEAPLDEVERALLFGWLVCGAPDN